MDEALMRRYYAAYNSENADALKAFYHPDCTLASAQGTLSGRDAILDMYQHIISMFEDRMTPVSIVVTGDEAQVAIVDQFIAKTDVADFMGQTLATGDTFELRLRGHYRAEEGRFRFIRVDIA